MSAFIFERSFIEMKLDNVYVAEINAIISHKIEYMDLLYIGDEYEIIPIKFALIYSKKGTKYYDLQTGEEYKTLKNYPDTGDLIVDVKTMKSYRDFLYDEQEKNPHLKVKNNMFKRKMLTLFNDAKKDIKWR